MININQIKFESSLYYNIQEIFVKAFFDGNTHIHINNNNFLKKSSKLENKKVDYYFWRDSFHINQNIRYVEFSEDYITYLMVKQMQIEIDRDIISSFFV